MIDGVKITPLKKFPDERGVVMRMLRKDDDYFSKFGEIYFSKVYPNVVKGWHKHKKMTLNYAVVSGMIKLVLFDDRIRSKTKREIQEIFLGEENYVLVTIPPKVWNGFKGISNQTAIVANCATRPHNPKEIIRLDPYENDIPYKWGLKEC